MRVLGFNFDKISGERKSREIIPNMKVSSSLNIRDIAEEKLDVVKEQTILKFIFDFATTYEKDYASLMFSGSILVASDKGKTKEILKMWKNKEVEPELRLSLYNLILNKCNVRSLQLEDEMGLPLHIQLPRISEQQKEEKSYTG